NANSRNNRCCSSPGKLPVPDEDPKTPMSDQGPSLSVHQNPPLPGSVPQVIRVYGDVRFNTDGDIQSLIFSADGNLWSIEDPGILRQWNALTGQQLGWTFLSDLEALWVLSGDARVLASASDDLALWEVAS